MVVKTNKGRGRSGTVVECLTQDRRAAGLSLTGVTALCPWARHINPSLVLVQPRETRPNVTERLLTGTWIKSNNQQRCHTTSTTLRWYSHSAWFWFFHFLLVGILYLFWFFTSRLYNFSVMSECVFLDWTSTKQRLKCLNCSRYLLVFTMIIGIHIAKINYGTTK